MEATSPLRPDDIVEVARPDILDVGRFRITGFPMSYRPVTVERLPLDVRSYPDATAVSLGASGRNPPRGIGGAYDANGDLIVETQRAKPVQNWFPTPLRLPSTVHPAKHLPGRTLFGGRHVGHFGHIMLETVSRFWADLDYDSYDHFVFIPKMFGRSKVSGLFGMLTGVTGVPVEKIVVATAEGVSFEQLDVPSTPFHMAFSADPRFLNAFDRIADRTVRDVYAGDLSGLPRRIYLSRSQLDDGRKKGQSSATNEAEAEAMFERLGFATVHPQKLPFSEQVALARNAEVIAGCNGSALHLAMFSRPGTKLLALDIRHVTNQYLIDMARGLDALHVWARSDDNEDWQTPWTMDLDRVRAAYDLLVADG